jgi:hypothetical protein
VSLPIEFVDNWKPQAGKLQVDGVPLTKLSKKELLAVAASAIVQLDQMSAVVKEAAEQRKQLASLFVRVDERPFSRGN